VQEAFPQANLPLNLKSVVKNSRMATYSYVSWSWKSLSSPLIFLPETLSGSTCKNILEDSLHTKIHKKIKMHKQGRCQISTNYHRVAYENHV
jgi:hypothetical protein